MEDKIISLFTGTTITYIVMVILGAVFVIMAFSQRTRLRPAFSFGAGPSFPISRVGRIALFFIGVIILFKAIKELVR
jgi:hypothetical protein